MTMREKRKGEKFMNKMNSKQRIIMESDAINLEQLEYKIRQQAYMYVSQRLAEIVGKDISELKIVTCHLSSACIHSRQDQRSPVLQIQPWE